jgi:hypothetical protein
MAGDAAQARRHDAHAQAASCCLQPARCADTAAHVAQTGERWTLWVKGPRGNYGKFEGVDSEQDVYDFTARWVSDKKLDVDPTLVSLRLVKCGPDVPTASEEVAAVELHDPSLTLAAAGVTGTAWMLAKVAGACNTAAREVACARAPCRC